VDCRTSWRRVSRTASSAAALLLLAGCGGGSDAPKLAHGDAAPLIDLAARIAREGSCAQARDIPRLSRAAIALVNSHRVPAALQEPLVSGVNDLSSHAPLCLPAVEPASTTPAPRPTPRAKPAGPGRGKHHGRGNGHGHGHDDGGQG